MATATVAGIPHPSKHNTTTPLRRISRGSLSALSASRSRPVYYGGGGGTDGADEDGEYYHYYDHDHDEPVLPHLSGVFAELSEAFEDLAVNFEGLDAINEDLVRFNNAFSGLIYGVKMNAYTNDFPEAPTPLNFQHAVTRAEAEAARLACEEREAAGAAASINARPSPTPSSAAGAALAGGGTLANNNNNNNNNDATFISQVGFPEDRPISSTLSRGGKIPRPGGAGTGRGGGGGGSGGTRGGVTKSAAQRKKEMVLKFAGPIVATLPIQYREQQPYRGDVETVIGALKDHHEGLRVAELVKMYPMIPQHRINDSLLTLVRAKHAIKTTNKGLLYRLDPAKYPPP